MMTPTARKGAAVAGKQKQRNLAVVNKAVTEDTSSTTAVSASEGIAARKLMKVATSQTRSPLSLKPVLKPTTSADASIREERARGMDQLRAESVPDLLLRPSLAICMMRSVSHHVGSQSVMMTSTMVHP
jgi:hypothetical protein